MLTCAMTLQISSCAGLASTLAERTAWLSQPESNGPPATVGALAPAPSPSMIYGHSHNDFAQAHPLKDALALGYRSVEADVWWSEGEVKVSHVGFVFVGTLRELYLDPLQERVQRLGSVYGDGEPFLLWLDLGNGDPELIAAVHRLLAFYPMIARMDQGGARGKVIAILTGDEDSKQAYTRRSGRKLRLYGLPESEALWEELLRAGVDLIGTDELAHLRHFLDARARVAASYLSPSNTTAGVTFRQIGP